MCINMEKKRLKGYKKAQEMLPVFILIGIMLGFSVYFIYYIQGFSRVVDNPFYGKLGLREMHLLAMYNKIEGDLFTLDILGRYALQESLESSADTFFINQPCAFFMGSPVLNFDGLDCVEKQNLVDISNELRQEMNSRLYSKVLSSDVYFPYRYDFHFIQDFDSLRVSGYSDSVVRYPIDLRDFSNSDYKPSPRLSSGELSFDISNQCTYLGTRNTMAMRRDPTGNYRCSHDFCVGKCPDGISIKFVPYFNQCNIPACQFGHCNINYNYICAVGCGFKSIQMAYAYYDYFFDELRSRNTNNIYDLLAEMRNARHLNIIEIQGQTSENDEDYLCEENIVDNFVELLCIVNEITDEDYDKILEMLETGLVRLKISYNGHTQRTRCTRGSSELGYCVSQHYILITAGNEDYLIAHDPLTPNREYRSGINVVLSKEFIKSSWTGHYSHIKGDRN